MSDELLFSHDAVCTPSHHRLAAVGESFPSADSFVSVQVYDRLLITSWGHDPGVVPTSNVLTMLNDALTHSAVLIQVNTHIYVRRHLWVTELVEGNIIPRKKSNNFLRLKWKKRIM